MKTINNRYTVCSEKYSNDSYREYEVVDNFEELSKNLLIFEGSQYNDESIKDIDKNLYKLKYLVHDHLYKIYDFDVITDIDGRSIQRNEYYLTIEKQGNLNLLDYKKLSLNESIECIRQLLDLMLYLSFRGVVYEYLNFDNLHIYREPNGEIVLKLRDIASCKIINTNKYQSKKSDTQFYAPELFWGATPSVSSEIYSLGMIIYYLYYRIDFKNNSIETLHKGVLNNDLVVDLRKATNLISSERFESIEEMVKVINDKLFLGIEMSMEKYKSFQSQTALIGKTKLIDKFIERINVESFDERRKFIFLVGDKGSGKSKFVYSLDNQIKRSYKFNIIKIEYKDTHISTLRTIARQFLKSQKDTAYYKYNVELMYLANYNNLNENGHMHKERLLYRMVQMIREYSINKKIIFLIDNFDKCDSEGRQFFDLLMKDLNANFFIVATTSQIPLPFKKTNASLYKEIKLQNLNLEETGQLIKSLLGMNQVPFRFSHIVHQATNGNPSNVKHLIKTLYKGNEIYIRDRSWVFDHITSEFINANKIIEDSNQSDGLLFMEEDDVKVLKCVSIFQNFFNTQEVSTLLNFSQKECERHLLNFVDNNVLEKRIGDNDYSYAFHKKNERETYYKLLTEEEKNKYNVKLLAIYENEYIENKKVTNEFISQLITIKDYERAGNFSVDIANQYKNNFNIISAIDQFEKSLMIYKKAGNQSRIIQILLELTHLSFRLGRWEKAQERAEEVLKLISVNDYKIRAEIFNLLMLIMIISCQHDEIEMFYNKSNQMSTKHVLKDIKFKSIDIYIQYLIECEKYDEVTTIINDMEKDIQADRHDEYHMAMLLRLKAHMMIVEQNYKRAKSYVEESILLYKKHDKDIGLAFSYHLYAKILFQVEKDYDEGIMYAQNALQLCKKLNYSILVPIFSMTVAFGKSISGHSKEAIDILNECYAEVDDKDQIFFKYKISFMLVEIYLLNGQYDLALIQSKKLEYAYEQKKLNNAQSTQLILFIMKYNLKFKNLKNYSYWRDVIKAHFPMSKDNQFQYNLLEIEHRFINAYVIKHVADIKFDLLQIKATKPLSAYKVRMLRGTLLDMGLQLVMSPHIPKINRLLEIDRYLTYKYDSRDYQVKHNIIKSIMAVDSTEYYMEVLDKEVIPLEWQWTVHMLLGKAYQTEKKYYYAMKSYVESISIINKLTQLLPLDYQSTYINYDENKNELRKYVESIVSIFIRVDKTIDQELALEYKGELREFFNMQSIEEVIATKNFQKMCPYDYYSGDKNIFTLKNIIDVIGKDDKDNLLIAMNYLQHITLAENCYLYLLDEKEQLREVIKGRNDYPTYNINYLLNHIGKDTEGIYINYLINNRYVHLLSDNEKGLILLPIYKVSTNKENRRKEDKLKKDKDTVAYVLLTTSNVINLVNEKTFKKCMETMNIIYTLIDYYNLKRNSSVDKLTGTFLRKHVEKMLNQEIKRSRDFGNDLSVMMIDIDKFKSVNDNYGHRKGDEILKSIGQLLNDNLRKGDYVGRYGGEEFLVCLPRTSKEDAFKVAEKIRKTVGSQKLINNEKSVTISIGVSTFPDDGTIESELIERADQALYYSKNNGRNRTTSWSEEINKSIFSKNIIPGILSGSVSEDTRVIQSILEMISLTNDKTKIKQLLINLLDMTQAEEISIISLDNDNFEKILYKHRGNDNIYQCNYPEYDMDKIIELAKKNEGGFFVDWKSQMFMTKKDQLEIKSYVFVPISSKKYDRQIVLLATDINAKEFDYEDLNLINVVKKIIESIIE